MSLFVALLVTLPVVKSSSVAEFLARPKTNEGDKLTGQAFADYINGQQPFFKAKHSPNDEEFVKARVMDIKYLFDPEAEAMERVAPKTGPKADLPKRFDAREQWPECASIISYIRDQSSCGSCWAVSAASAMSDRACIRSNGRVKRQFSDSEILSCCGSNCGFGCNGGWPSRAYGYAWRHGVSTGGRYREKNACQPYVFYPCGYHKNQTYYGPCPNGLWKTPSCRKKCQLKYPIPFEKDKIYNKQTYIVLNNETLIRQEIMENGPVVAVFEVYRDFSQYKGGIYIHTTGGVTGAHAVKIIGWGEEDEVPYWLIANSWNTDWGENGGYFRILRGDNHCKIESQVVGGILDV